MSISSYYVYALKDPIGSMAKPFYIGKGTGIRAWEHLKIDETRKGKYIQEIRASGREVVVTVLAEGLTELQALKLESELIVAFGTVDTGGYLTNTVIPTGKRKVTASTLVIPYGVVEKAQLGLKLLLEATLELGRANPNGVTNSDCVKALGLQSSYLGGSKDYLSWSLLGLLMQEGKMKRSTSSKRHIAQTQ